MGLTQAVVRSLTDVTELPSRRTRAGRGIVDGEGVDDDAEG